MCTSQRGSALPTLYTEHLSLGATFDDERSPLVYHAETPLDKALGEVLLCDASAVPMLLFHGMPATSFARTSFAGRELEVGECACEAVLTGDGSVASVPLLARTGASEYLVLDRSARSDVLSAWLSFLANIEQDGTRPFEGLATEDVTSSHVVLALAGDKVEDVLGDYVSPGDALPGPGQVRSLNLDRIPCIVLGVPLGKGSGKGSLYLVLVPPRAGSVLWRSLLSFANVSPVGSLALDELLSRTLPWYGKLATQDSLRLSASSLRKDKIVRNASDFVGARGLD